MPIIEKNSLENGNYLVERYRTSIFSEKDEFDTFLTVLRYNSPMCFYTHFSERAKEIFENEQEIGLSEIKLIQFDTFGAYTGYVLTNFSPSNTDLMLKVLGEKKERLQKFATAIIVFYSKLHIISEPSEYILIKYFLNQRIDEKDLNNYKDNQLTDKLIETVLKIKHPQYGIFENFQLLYTNKLISIKKYSSFLEKSFINEEYLNPKVCEMLLAFCQDNPDLFDKLIKLTYKVDPFSKEVFFSQWLKDIKKYDFLYSLLVTLDIDSKKEPYKSFICKHDYLKKMKEYNLC